MEIRGLSGQDIQVRQVKNNVSVEQLKAATKNNGMDEIVVENDKGKFILFAESLDIKGKFGLPSVGENISFGDFKGKVVLSDNEHLTSKTENASSKIKDLCIKTPNDLASDAKAATAKAANDAKIASEKARADLRNKISKAETVSDENINVKSIYGPQVSHEDAQGWLDNNKYLSQSPKLLKIADFKNRDGKIDAEELSRIASSGVVVLNGPDSFYLPSEYTKITQPTSEQVRNDSRAKAANVTAAAIIGAVIVGVTINSVTKDIGLK